MSSLGRAVSLVLVAATFGCSSGSPSEAGGAEGGTEAGSGVDGGLHDGAAGGEGGGDAQTGAKIAHLVVIVQENHTFDAYFGRWCTAATGSNPTCTSGASCCEAGPAKDPGSSTTPSVLNDNFNASRDPNHLQSCELTEIDDGKMDGFVTSTTCGSAQNFAYADTTAQPYWTLAQQGALADHYFQPIVGASSSNDMYLARAQFVFIDNAYEPQAIGAGCEAASTKQYTDTTVADLLVQAGLTWSWYAAGYDDMKAAAANGKCPSPPAACPLGVETYPCVYDPGDDPFAFYASLVDKPAYFKDYTQLATDLAGGTLPAVSFVKGYGYQSEHPGYGDTISAGTQFVTSTITAIEGSSYKDSTLVLVTWDEGGGFFDHVAPPPSSTVDNQPYGTRLPLLAAGPLARAGAVSHVVMEHSSIVKFIEWNWLGATGQLHGRDATVANIGSMLDASLGVPEN